MPQSIPFRAVIFDMDGVLLDSEPLHYEALRSVLATEGHEWSHENNERLLGTTVADSFRIISETVVLRNPVESYIPVYDRAVVEVLSQPLTPAPGVFKLIEQLDRLGVPMAVASSSLRSWVDATLMSLGIRDRFAVIVPGEQVQTGKPAPDIYLLTAERLGVSPENCIAIEDAPNGILSGRRAGMPVVAVRTEYTRNLSLADATAVVDSLVELHPVQEPSRWRMTFV